MLKRVISKLPYLGILVKRKYYATGTGTLIVNLFFKYFLRINARVDALVHFTSRVNSPDKLLIEGEENTSVYLSMASSGGCYYQAINGIEFKEGVLWSYGCQFISANHDFINRSKHEQCQPIILEKDVWLGANVVVLPGVRIGSGTIVGAGSVVTKNLPSNSVCGGVPCKVLKSL